LYYDLHKLENKKSYRVENNNLILQNFLKKELVNRVKKLENMEINDWYKYNDKNKIIKYKNKEYYIFLWEKVKTDFVNRVNINKLIENISWEDTYNLLQGIQFLSNKRTDKNILNNMYYLYKNNTTNFIDYFWVDNFPIDNTIKKVRGLFIKYQKNDITGIIGIHYPRIDNIIESEKQKAINITGNLPFIINYAIIFIILLIIINDKMIKNLYFVILLTYLLPIGYSYYYMNTKISGVHPMIEFNKLDLQSKNIGSIAFLSGVNIFIINHNKHNDNFILFSLLFSASVFFLLLSIFQYPEANNYSQNLFERARSQYYFNMCITFNILIIIIFILSFL
jgi:hypothetical protein